jgi:hypothetical protein
MLFLPSVFRIKFPAAVQRGLDVMPGKDQGAVLLTPDVGSDVIQ